MSIDNRTITVGAAGYKPDIIKQPNDAWFLTIDASDWLGGATTIASASATSITGSPGTAPVIGAFTVVNSGKSVQALLSAGTDKWVGVATIDILTVDGQTKEVELEIIVRNTAA